MSDFNCGNCSYRFNKYNYKPLGLPCGHTFCLNCLKTQWDTQKYINCFECNVIHFQSYLRLSPNFSFMKLLEGKGKIKSYCETTESLQSNSNNSLEEKGYQHTSTTIEKKDYHLLEAYNELEMEQKEFFSFIAGQANETIEEDECPQEKDQCMDKKYSMLFNYFEILRFIIGYFDRNKDKIPVHADYPKLFQFLRTSLKTIVIILLLVLNYVMLANNIFMRVSLFAIITYECHRCNTNEGVNKCLKIWIGIIFLVILDEVISLLYFENLWTCLTTMYVLILLGPSVGLELIVMNIFRSLMQLDLLVTSAQI